MLIKPTGVDEIFQGNDIEKEQKAWRNNTEKDLLRKRLGAWCKRKKLS